MNMTSVCNPATKRTYSVSGPVYEGNNVWCGTGRDPELGEIFVKLLQYMPGARNAEEIRRLGRREAETMERVARCTAGVPRLYDHWDDRSRNAYVLVMQKMPGVTLRRWLEDRKPVRPDGKTVWLHSLILRQVAQILLDIHNKIPGISHRDIKPENVMIWLDQNKHWQVGLIDFGTAALNYSVAVGTYGYQPPEQMTLESTIMGSGEAKDVFALGMMWYELLTGTPADALYGAFLFDFENRCWEARPSFPPELLATEQGSRYGRLFEKMTSYDPGKRPALRDVVNRITVRRNPR